MVDGEDTPRLHHCYDVVYMQTCYEMTNRSHISLILPCHSEAKSPPPLLTTSRVFATDSLNSWPRTSYKVEILT